MTPEERQSIIDEAVNKAVERALLVLPDTVGSLLTDHIALSKINSEFYAKHPEFKTHKESVASVLEKLDGENPLLDHKDLLDKAIPEIRERIKTVESLNMDSVSPNPSRVYEPLSSAKIENPHGKL